MISLMKPPQRHRLPRLEQMPSLERLLPFRPSREQDIYEPYGILMTVPPPEQRVTSRHSYLAFIAER